MVNLAIDDETYTGLQAQAERAGMTVEEWLRHIAADELDEPEERSAREDLLAKLHEFARTATRTGHLMDDSRESIYD